MSENKQNWDIKNPVGRPQKVDRDGQPVYRIPTSIYLDIRMKAWIIKKSGNLSEWIEKMIRSAYLSEYCFWCFDDNIKVVPHGVVCCNEKHRRMAGNGAPSVVLLWRQCPNCDSWYNEMNMPTEMGDGRVICCGICKDQFMKEEKEDELAEIKWEAKNS